MTDIVPPLLKVTAASRRLEGFARRTAKFPYWQTAGFLLRPHGFPDIMHQLGELLVGRLGLGVHEIEDFAGLIGHG